MSQKFKRNEGKKKKKKKKEVLYPGDYLQVF